MQVANLNYASPETVLFQRLSVIATDIIFFLAIVYYARGFNSANAKRALVVGLTFLNPGLLLVDHVHFQYNGFMLGLLILSITLIERGNELMGGARSRPRVATGTLTCNGRGAGHG